jgi:hypothetical protein
MGTTTENRQHVVSALTRTFHFKSIHKEDAQIMMAKLYDREVVNTQMAEIGNICQIGLTKCILSPDIISYQPSYMHHTHNRGNGFVYLRRKTAFSY